MSLSDDCGLPSLIMDKGRSLVTKDKQKLHLFKIMSKSKHVIFLGLKQMLWGYNLKCKLLFHNSYQWQQRCSVIQLVLQSCECHYWQLTSVIKVWGYVDAPIIWKHTEWWHLLVLVLQRGTYCSDWSDPQSSSEGCHYSSVCSVLTPAVASWIRFKTVISSCSTLNGLNGTGDSSSENPRFPPEGEKFASCGFHGKLHSLSRMNGMKLIIL